jgi:hypothetical protein
VVTPYAVLADLEARFPRDLTADEEDRAGTLLADASFWLGVWVPGLAEAIAGGDETAQEAAKLVVVNMVKRSILAEAASLEADPSIESITEGAGIYNRAIRYRSPDGNLWISSRELEDLLALLMVNRAAAVSMRSPGL